MNLSDEERRRRADRMRAVAAKQKAIRAAAEKVWTGEQADIREATDEADRIPVHPLDSPRLEKRLEKIERTVVAFDVARFFRLKAFYAKKKANAASSR